MATKKYTRKQLKQPDEFITFSMRAWEFLKVHAIQVGAGIAVASLIIGVVWIWTAVADSGKEETTGHLTRAMDIYDQPIIELKTPLPKDDDPDAVPRFKTLPEKLKASAEALTKVVDDGSGDLPELALLIRAGVHFDAAQYTEAIRDYNAFIKKSSDPQLQDLARESLGYAFEASKSLDKALEQFRLLPREGSKQFRGIYHEARILALQGKKKEAIALYKKILDKGSDSAYATQAGARLASLER